MINLSSNDTLSITPFLYIGLIYAVSLISTYNREASMGLTLNSFPLLSFITVPTLFGIYVCLSYIFLVKESIGITPLLINSS